MYGPPFVEERVCILVHTTKHLHSGTFYKRTDKQLPVWLTWSVKRTIGTPYYLDDGTVA